MGVLATSTFAIIACIRRISAKIKTRQTHNVELKVKSALGHINVTIIDCSESGSKELRANVDIIRTLESSKVQTILFTSFDNK